ALTAALDTVLSETWDADAIVARQSRSWSEVADQVYRTLRAILGWRQEVEVDEERAAAFAGVLTAFLAAFFAGDFLAGAFLTAAFFAGVLLTADFLVDAFWAGDFLAAFLATAFFATAFV